MPESVSTRAYVYCYCVFALCAHACIFELIPVCVCASVHWCMCVRAAPDSMCF